MVKGTAHWSGKGLSLANCCSSSPGSTEGCIASSPVQPPPHPSDTQAGWFSVSLDVSVEALVQSMGLPSLGHNVVHAGMCSRGPSVLHVLPWPSAPLLPKAFMWEAMHLHTPVSTSVGCLVRSCLAKRQRQRRRRETQPAGFEVVYPSKHTLETIKMKLCEARQEK